MGGILMQVNVLLFRPGELTNGQPGGPEHRAFSLHAWADRFDQPRPGSARQPLVSLTAHTGSQACPAFARSLHLLQLCVQCLQSSQLIGLLAECLPLVTHGNGPHIGLFS